MTQSFSEVRTEPTGEVRPGTFDEAAPVFVDERGRRRRAIRLAGTVLSAVLVLVIGAIGLAFAGGASLPLPGLPSGGGHHPGTGHVPALAPTQTVSTSPTATSSASPSSASASSRRPTATPSSAATTAPGVPHPTSTHSDNGHGQTTHPSHGPKG